MNGYQSALRRIGHFLMKHVVGPVLAAVIAYTLLEPFVGDLIAGVGGVVVSHVAADWVVHAIPVALALVAGAFTFLSTQAPGALFLVLAFVLGPSLTWLLIRLGASVQPGIVGGLTAGFVLALYFGIVLLIGHLKPSATESEPGPDYRHLGIGDALTASGRLLATVFSLGGLLVTGIASVGVCFYVSRHALGWSNLASVGSACALALVLLAFAVVACAVALRSLTGATAPEPARASA